MGNNATRETYLLARTVVSAIGTESVVEVSNQVSFASRYLGLIYPTTTDWSRTTPAGVAKLLSRHYRKSELQDILWVVRLGGPQNQGLCNELALGKFISECVYR